VSYILEVVLEVGQRSLDRKLLASFAEIWEDLKAGNSGSSTLVSPLVCDAAQCNDAIEGRCAVIIRGFVCTVKKTNPCDSEAAKDEEGSGSSLISKTMVPRCHGSGISDSLTEGV
jgi:hypothetical protein